MRNHFFFNRKKKDTVSRYYFLHPWICINRRESREEPFFFDRKKDIKCSTICKISKASSRIDTSILISMMENQYFLLVCRFLTFGIASDGNDFWKSFTEHSNRDLKIFMSCLQNFQLNYLGSATVS